MAPLYGRYVPPKGPKRKTPTAPPEPVAEVAAESPAETSKKRRREIPQPYPVEEPEETLIAEATSEEASIETLEFDEYRSKKRKRENKHPVSKPVSEDESTPSKHKTLLTKFERSSKLAEAIRSKSTVAPDQIERSQDSTQELHGEYHRCT